MLKFLLLLSGWDSVVSTHISKFVPSVFQTPSDNFSFKFSALKMRILHVLYIFVSILFWEI